MQSGAASLNYAGNSSAPALTIWGAGIWAGAAVGTYVPLAANATGAAASTIQRRFSPCGGNYRVLGARGPTMPGLGLMQRFRCNGHGTDSRRGLVRLVAWPMATRLQTMPPRSRVRWCKRTWPITLLTSPTTVDTLPPTGALPYYPRFWLSERTVTATTAAFSYARFLPPAASFGGLSD